MTDHNEEFFPAVEVLNASRRDNAEVLIEHIKEMTSIAREFYRKMKYLGNPDPMMYPMEFGDEPEEGYVIAVTLPDGEGGRVQQVHISSKGIISRYSNELVGGVLSEVLMSQDNTSLYKEAMLRVLKGEEEVVRP